MLGKKEGQKFKLHAPFKPAGDQPEAILALVKGVERGDRMQTLLGATGTGKSVISETPVLVMENGQAKMVEIGLFVDRFFAENGRRISSVGDTEYINLEGCEEFKTYSFNSATGESNWQVIKQFSRHASPAKLFKISLSCGRSVVVTGNHNFYILKEGKINLCEVKDISVGDHVPVPRRVEEIDQNKKAWSLLDSTIKQKVFVTLPNFTRSWAENRTRFSSIISNKKAASVIDYGERISFSTYKALTEIDTALMDKAEFSMRVGNTPLLHSQELTPEIARLLGYYIAEGHASHYCFIISSEDNEIINDFIQTCNENGIHHFHPVGSYDYRFSSLAWVTYFIETCGGISQEKRLPNFWPSLSSHLLAEMLKAYFSGDGGVDGGDVTAMTASQALASDIQYALLRFGINARTHKRMVKVPNKLERRAYWRISISGQENLERYARYIGFVLQRKTEALEKIMNKDGNTNVDVIPLGGSWLRRIRTELALHQRHIANAAGVRRTHISHIELDKRKPSVTVFFEIINFLSKVALQKGNKKLFDEIQQKKNLGETFWSPISFIEEVFGDGFVYDFAVEENETFLAGSGGLFVHNTFTIAEVIERTQKPTLVMAHNKTLAAQLCNEFREFFPNNAVEYFVSYYDYYQPEAYMPGTDTYIEKEAMINQEIDRLRHAATQALLTRRDVIIVSSVSCIYGLGSPKHYLDSVLQLTVGDAFNRTTILKKLIEMQFVRTTVELARGTFRMRGEILDIVPIEEGRIYRIDGSGGKIKSIELFDAVSRKSEGKANDAWVFPAKHYLADKSVTERALKQISDELEERLAYFDSKNMLLEADRLRRRTRYDITMIKEIGYVNGVENYSRYFDGRKEGQPPFTLLDYFPEDYLTVIDESHVTLPQVGAMSGGDSARKNSLVDFGFRLPSARDNRPLTGDEFLAKTKQVIFVSATPADFERKRSTQVVQQIIRPTGLVDPEIIMMPVTAKGEYHGQVQDLIERAVERAKRDERVMVTTLTKKMAEDLTDYLKDKKVKVKYLHSDIDTIERIQILGDFRRGIFDVLVGVNLLREGLDVPEVSLVAILDADKEGFLRSDTALIQTIGRAARNAAGQVVLYADHMTGSLERAIGETERRREIQLAYNKKHGITPQTIKKAVRDLLKDFGLTAGKGPKAKGRRAADGGTNATVALDLAMEAGKPLDQIIREKESQMRTASKELQFELAAILRDELVALKKELKKSTKNSTLLT